MEGYSCRPLKSSDDQAIKRWRRDTDKCVSGHTLLARTIRKGYKERLAVYKEWRALMVVKKLPSLSVPVACCGWGVKKVRLQDTELNIGFMMDGMVNPDDKSSLSIAVRGDIIKSWKDCLDGECAPCCTSGNLSCISFDMLVELGFTVAGSSRVYTWSDTVQPKYKQAVANLEVVRKYGSGSGKSIIPFWNDVFRSFQLTPVDLTEISNNPCYMGTVIVKSSEEWATVTRWDQNSVAPMVVEGGSMVLKYETLCLCACSDQKILLEAIRVASQDAMRNGCDLIACVIDESFDIVKSALDNLGASCARYVKGIKMAERLNKCDTSLPLFWDPRDLGATYALVKSPAHLPRALKENPPPLTNGLVKEDPRTTLKKRKKPEDRTRGGDEASADIRVVSMLVYFFTVSGLMATMHAVRLLPLGKPILLADLLNISDLFTWILVRVWCLLAFVYDKRGENLLPANEGPEYIHLAMLVCVVTLSLDPTAARLQLWHYFDIVLCLYHFTIFIWFVFVATPKPPLVAKPQSVSIVNPLSTTIISLGCSIVCLKVLTCYALYLVTTSFNYLFDLQPATI
eukprot:TRINITY_DN6703_c0_g1_i1.p1 TRINITY_DN6703_c0_g1~~TRINITY_DN6703_c0_g1_i1.p1  ORF type:complete len:570 (+),score=181.47 TRINITY_DN6703_c0_g1_i1:66-1775(+)